MKDSIILELENILGPERVLRGTDLNDQYHHIWKMEEGLTAKAMVLPASTAEVAAVMKICSAHKQPIVVHGGRTNLVGSTETKQEEVVISMERLNTIEELDAQSRTITVQAGVILQHIQEAAQEENLLFPLNFGAKGTAQIGGIVATNAGGLRVFRFGMTRQLVLGIEAVLADGTIVSSLKKIIKDNSAYDLKQLFIGSEGTLGIVTQVVLKLVEAPKSRNSALAGFDSYEKVVRFLKFMDSGLAGTLSGFELMWEKTYRALTSPPSVVKPPLPYGYKYYVLLESLGSHQQRDQERMEALLAEALEEQLVVDAALAQNQADLQWFWQIREDVHVLASQCDYDQHFDISLPIPKVENYIDQVVRELKTIPQVNNYYTFGHVADGNIHIIVGKTEQTDSLIKAINKVVYDPLTQLNGSVSAEHGIGLHKKSYLPLCRTEAEIALMKTLKQAMDPDGILNRGKIF